jgi:hypothetical protein
MDERMAQIKTEDVLDAFYESHNPPTGPVRSFPSQAHFDQQLEVTKDFEGSCEPLVPRVLFGPRAGISRVGRRWDKGFVFWIRLHDLVEQCVVIQTGRVQQCRHWHENQAKFEGAGWSTHMLPTRVQHP